MFVLENDILKLECTDNGGQMLSLLDKRNDTEILYQRDEAWKDSNPSLFPIIGSVWQKEYTIHGKKYEMKNHGLVRYATLEGKQEKDAILFSYYSDEETKKQYPFDFEFKMKYELIEDKVKISYEIKNTSKEDMPFSFGLHPAFRTSVHEGEKFEDYSIRFIPKGEATQLIFTPDLDPVQKVKVQLDEWQLNREDIDKYATIVYTDLPGDKVELCCNGKPKVEVEFPEFPFLALWSHPTRPDFICIEPWFGHADFEKVEDNFYTREGTQILKPDEVFKCHYSIKVFA